MKLFSPVHAILIFAACADHVIPPSAWSDDPPPAWSDDPPPAPPCSACSDCNCATGQCPLCMSDGADKFASTPPTTPPGPNFKWKKIPGAGGSYGGYGWVQDGAEPVSRSTVVKQPAIGPVTTQTPMIVANPFLFPQNCPNGKCPIR